MGSDADDPELKKMAAKLLELAKGQETNTCKDIGDYIVLPKNEKEIVLSSELESGITEEDVYLKTTAGNFVVTTNKSKNSETGVETTGAEPVNREPKIGKKKLKKLKREARAKTKGDGWFNMPALEMTEERKRDLEIVQMRGALDPKKFYKKNDWKTLPKY